MAERATDLGLIKPPPWNVNLADLDPRFAELWTDPALKILGFPGGGWPRRNLIDREPFTAVNGPDLVHETVHGPAVEVLGRTSGEKIRWPDPLVGERAGTALYWYQPDSSNTWGQGTYRLDLCGGNLGGFIDSTSPFPWRVENDFVSSGYTAINIDVGIPTDSSSQILMCSRAGTDAFASRNGIVKAAVTSFPDEDWDTWGFNSGRETPGDFGNFDLNGALFAHLVWTRALTEAEHELIGSDPFGFIRYVGRRTLVTVPVAVSPSLEGYRWRNDDGSESTATWAQAQDVDHSVNVDEEARLRLLIENPSAGQVTIQYAEDGTEDWFDLTE